MTRESVEQKAARLLAQERLTITSLIGDHVNAVCTGPAVLVHALKQHLSPGQLAQLADMLRGTA